LSEGKCDKGRGEVSMKPSEVINKLRKAEGATGTSAKPRLGSSFPSFWDCCDDNTSFTRQHATILNLQYIHVIPSLLAC
jgi:hypothetical protein